MRDEPLPPTVMTATEPLSAIVEAFGERKRKRERERETRSERALVFAY